MKYGSLRQCASQSLVNLRQRWWRSSLRTVPDGGMFNSVAVDRQPDLQPRLLVVPAFELCPDDLCYKKSHKDA